MRAPFASLLTTPWPTVAVEIAQRQVTAVALRSGVRRRAVRAHATVRLQDDDVAPALTTINVSDVERVGAAVRSVLDQVGGRPRQIGLIVPDAVAKVSLLRFDQVPNRADDLRSLIGWQVQKAAPFAIEDAQLSYTPTGTDGEFVVALAKRNIVEQYEAACTAAGVHAGVVDLSTFNLVNAVLASDSPGASGDWLLVHIDASATTIAIVRGARLAFYRNGRTTGEAELANFVHQSTMYYEDRLGGGGFQRIIVAGAGEANVDALQASVEARTGQALTPIDPRPAATLSSRQSDGQATLDAIASPIGLLLRRAAT